MHVTFPSIHGVKPSPFLQVAQSQPHGEGGQTYVGAEFDHDFGTVFADHFVTQALKAMPRR